MIAAPSVRGPKSLDWNRITTICVYLIAMIAGTIATATVLHFVGGVFGRPPAVVVGFIALTCAWAAGTNRTMPIIQSRWMIPRSWGRLGSLPYSAIFGWILGLGFVTRVGSVGYYVLLVWGLASQTWSEVGLVFCAYGACRALPLLAIAISARVRSQNRDRELRRWDGVAVAVLPGEIALLVAISVLSIAGGGI